MLILTRKKNETIHIGEDILITIVRVSGSSVRIGVSAPRELPVLRIELQKDDEPGDDVVEAAA